jgi:DNA-binding LacI/PurR family transcriptional regulator
VSFVLNRTPGQTISEATRQRVEEAARELDYAPHGTARALREGSSRIVLLLVEDSADGGALRSFIAGMRAELEAEGCALVVQPVGAVTTSAEEVLAGVRPRAVLDLTLPYAPGAEGSDGGWVDGLAAHGLTQLQHLTEHGHERIALALPPRTRRSASREARRSTAQQAAARLGLEPLTETEIGTDAAAALTAVSALLEASPRVTAVAGLEDESALRTLAALADLGLSAPEDLAVIGFDESRHSAIWRPALTTVRIEAEVFGRRAARVALGRDPGEWTVPPSAIVRRETA